MVLEFASHHKYNLIEETAIETECGALYKGMDLEYGRSVAVKIVRVQGENQKQKEANLQISESPKHCSLTTGSPLTLYKNR